MLRAFAPRIRAATQRRGFVSTVLLTRNWETENVNTLKTELRKRGLLQTGNKATLITRLQEYERDQSMQTPPPAVRQQVRFASSTEVPGVPSTAEPSPIPSSFPKEFLDVKIPNTNVIPPEPPIQVPFVPDFWESARVKAQSAPRQPAEPVNPKVVAVAGAVTHLGGGPTHALHPRSNTSTGEPAQPFDFKLGAFGELLKDLLPGSLQAPLKGAVQEPVEGLAEAAQTSERFEPIQRSLDETEKQGVYALFGIIAGSLLLGGIFAPTPAFAEKEERSVADKAAEQL